MAVICPYNATRNTLKFTIFEVDTKKHSVIKVFPHPTLQISYLYRILSKYSSENDY